MLLLLVYVHIMDAVALRHRVGALASYWRPLQHVTAIIAPDRHFRDKVADADGGISPEGSTLERSPTGSVGNGRGNKHVIWRLK